MTSFSILMARFQGDLTEQVRGTLGIERLKGGDRVLVAETCTHHPIGDDIGRVKIPRWLTQYVGAKLEFQHVQGRDFPADLSPYRLVVHCGNCTGNRREMLSRIHRCREAGVPITNYGLTIAYSLGIFERALAPFPAALEAFRAARGSDAPRPRRAIAAWLAEPTRPTSSGCGRGPTRCARAHVGDAVHLRGLIEISNYCVRHCVYCGIRACAGPLPRYRMTRDEILAAARAGARPRLRHGRAAGRRGPRA